MGSVNFKAALCGFAIGAINGLFGGGGGMVAVPALTNILGYGTKQAHATAIFVIAPLCVIALFGYIFGGYIDMQIVVPTAVGSVAGGFLGAGLLDKIPQTAVRVLFIAVMIAAGIRMAVG